MSERTNENTTSAPPTAARAGKRNRGARWATHGEEAPANVSTTVGRANQRTRPVLTSGRSDRRTHPEDNGGGTEIRLRDLAADRGWEKSSAGDFSRGKPSPH